MTVRAVYVVKSTTLTGNYAVEAVWVPNVPNGPFAGTNLPPGVYRVVDGDGQFAQKNAGLTSYALVKGGGLPDPPGTLTAALKKDKPEKDVRGVLDSLLSGQGDNTPLPPPKNTE